MSIKFHAKRIYDPPSEQDGYRILVDRLWPRGVTKQAARIDLWAKDFTPSHELRKWFHENHSLLEEFATRYRLELEESRSLIQATLSSIQHSRITLITATTDLEYGHAGVLKRFLESIVSAYRKSVD